MKMNKMFGNIEFGSVKYNLSHLGIAVENAGGEMKKYCGKKLRIDTIKNLGNTYYYTMTAIPWTFTSEMFEKGDLSMLITRRQECIK